MGFVPRTGIHSSDLYVAFQPRPERFGIRQFFFEVEPTVITDLHGPLENWRVFTAPFNVRTESGEHLEWNYIPTFEHLDAPFEIQPGVVIPPGSYRWTRYRTEVNTATKRPWVVDFAFRWGSFYDGSLRQYQPALTLKPSPHVAVVLQMERDEGALPQGDFVTAALLRAARLQLLAQRDLVQPRPVRQRLAHPRLPEPVPVDPEARGTISSSWSAGAGSADTTATTSRASTGLGQAAVHVPVLRCRKDHRDYGNRRSPPSDCESAPSKPSSPNRSRENSGRVVIVPKSRSQIEKMLP